MSLVSVQQQVAVAARVWRAVVFAREETVVVLLSLLVRCARFY